jgi:hypothetical protein
MEAINQPKLSENTQDYSGTQKILEQKVQQEAEKVGSGEDVHKEHSENNEDGKTVLNEEKKGREEDERGECKGEGRSYKNFILKS